MLNDELILYTTENFSKLVEEKHEGDIKIILHFKCSDDREDYISVYQKIAILNRNSPVFSRKIYHYKLGMAIPEDFELTELLPINATDVDYTTNMIYFTIDFNQDFRLGYKGVTDGKGVFSTRLSSLKTIRAPYRKEFSITATDDGFPKLNSTATLIVTVMDNVDNLSGENTSPKCNGAIGKSFNILLLLIIHASLHLN
ncbi:hypothetical protein PPYR_10345 [Photinus pyralis]|uniref:Cadherin domain-containing protein n=1 Tax=Photinus pyralis TaxID=7054 RepID=A0A5N4AG47_PHOPY|nr:hypothetical protein PPYR_10345 [Photinus pyralis]